MTQIARATYRGKEMVLDLAPWYRLPQGQLCRALAFTLWEGGALIDVSVQGGTIQAISWKLGERPLLEAVYQARPGEWWRFKSCSRHGSKNQIGELPFMVPDPWPYYGNLNAEMVSCGCLVPDETLRVEA